MSYTNGKLSIKSHHDKVNLLERKMRVKRWPAYVSLDELNSSVQATFLRVVDQYLNTFTFETLKRLFLLIC